MSVKTFLLGAAVLLLLIFSLSHATLTDEQTARRILTDDAVTGIRFTGYVWLACSKDDWYHTGFSGTKNGRPVSGVVCDGLWGKGNTIRYY